MTSVDEKTLTLDDFLQLQALLVYEREVRNEHIKQYSLNQQAQETPVVTHRHVLFRRANDPRSALQSKLEEARLSEALLKLKRLKEQYKRERTIEIQLYLEYYRRQALIRAVLQEEEERHYRRCIAAAVEQRRVQACLQQYLDLKRQEELQSQFEAQPFFSDEKEQQQQPEHQLGYNEYHYKQLEALLKHIFNHDHKQDHEIACSKQETSEQEQALAMAEVWKYLADEKTTQETPRFAFLPADHDTIINNPSSQSTECEKEVVKEDTTSTNTNHDSNFPPVQDHVVPLQELIHHLASAPVLVDEVQFSDEPKPSGIWAKQSTPPPLSLSANGSPVLEEKKEEPAPEPYLPQHIFTDAEPTPKLENAPGSPAQDEDNEDEKEQESPFFPQSILTDAEPTPVLENAPNSPLKEHVEEKKAFLPQRIFTEAEPTPVNESFSAIPICPVVEEVGDSTQSAQHFVDSVAAEQKNENVPVDPRKIKALEELASISKILHDRNSHIVSLWESVLKRGRDGSQSLTFVKQKEGTMLLTASTEFNREFLGAEDELMRVLLRLDTIDGLGDESIRIERKKLVKVCESMLEELDNFKQTQWEHTMKQQFED